MSRQLDISDIIKITSAGVDVATFSEIRSAIIRRYQSVYGSDIDLSTGSADGVFVNDLSLMINNILQAMKTMYTNLDVNSASGVYLDSLCRLSNIVRKQATASRATVLVRNIGQTMLTIQNGLEFVDKSGSIWSYQGDDLELVHSEYFTSIQLVCETSGQIKAPAGWITNTVEMLDLEVVQETAAVIGTNVESDSDLRARRNQSNGSAGLTVLESLAGALLLIEGISDVLIFNNPNSEADTTSANDGTTILPHSIYVVIRQREDVEISDSVIGSLIYNKLTPGIRTSMSADTDALRTYEFMPPLLGYVNVSLEQYVYWKRAIPINPTITFKIQPKQFFTDDEIPQIANAVIQYANNLRLNRPIDVNDMLLEIIDSDSTFKGNRTFSIDVNDISVETLDNSATYYAYSNASHSTDSSTGKIEITIT